MNVLHVIPAIAPRYGGPSAAVLSLLPSLKTHEVDICLSATDADGAVGRVDSGKLEATFPIRIFERDFSETWKVSFRLWRWLKQHLHEYDLVHIHAAWSFSTAVAAREAARQNVPYILRPAGMLSDYSFNHKGWKKTLYWKAIERRTIDCAAVFHATSPGEADDIRQLRPDARIFVIPNGVEDAAFLPRSDPNHSALLSAHVFDESVPLILFLSRLHPKKGIVDRLLPAFSQLKGNAHLIIAGDEDSHFPGYRVEVEKAIDSLNLTDRVSLIGSISGNTRWDYYRLADLFVLPSHSENFGIVIGEAMACGCPIVTTEQVQSSPLVQQAGAGRVVGGSIHSLALAMDEILSKPELANAMSDAGSRFALDNLRWDMVASQVVDMYAEVLK